jgi:transposase
VDKDELKRLSKNDLVRLVLGLQERVKELEKMVARLLKNSSTSSKPPSSDIVKPPKPKPRKGRRGKRRIGGQPGHEKHERKPFPPEQVDETYEYAAVDCSRCGSALPGRGEPARVVQQVELVERPFRVSEHVVMGESCPCCGEYVAAPLPGEVLRGGLFGPRLSAFVAYLKGGCHASYSTIQALLTDVLAIPVSRSFLVKVVGRARAALDGPYDELRSTLAEEPWLNVDETGHKECGQRYWTWCFRAPWYTVFKIDSSRGSCVLEEVLGNAFGGVLGSDLYSAYVKYAGDHALATQLCLAHLIRDIRYLTTLSDKVTANYGRRVLDAIKKLFRALHRRDRLSPSMFRRRLEEAKTLILKKGKAAPPRSEAQTMAERFKKHGESYFTFITAPGVAPTNNAAEQAIRHVVIDRRVTQGTRGSNGQRWCERIWTTMATCAQQGRSAFEFLQEAMRARVSRTAPPSLLPALAMEAGP